MGRSMQPRVPYDWTASCRPIEGEWHGRHLVAPEDQLHLHVEFARGIKPGQRTQLPVGRAARQKVAVLLESEGAELDEHAGLLVPDLVAHHGAEPQLFGVALARAQSALRIAVHGVPGADELFGVHGHVEIVPEDLLQRLRGTRVQGQQAAVEQQRVVGNHEPHVPIPGVWR